MERNNVFNTTLLLSQNAVHEGRRTYKAYTDFKNKQALLEAKKCSDSVVALFD